MRSCSPKLVGSTPITALTIDTRAVSGAQVDGNADQLLRVVRNLLDNAARHATSVVTVTLGEVAGDAVLRVRGLAAKFLDMGAGLRPT